MQVPDVVLSFVPPVPYDSAAFGWHTNGFDGRCSLCLLPAATMARAGQRRWLAFCAMHDSQRRWVREPRSIRWWYLPPPLGNSSDSWWYLDHHPAGFCGGRPGWYLHERRGFRIIETRVTTIHRARAITESCLAQLFLSQETS